MHFESSTLALLDTPHLRLRELPATRVTARHVPSAYEYRYWLAAQAARTKENQEIQRLAQGIVEFLRKAVAALTPFIGEKSINALYKRSLYLNHTKYPWLSVAYGELLHPTSLSSLQDLVSRQTLANVRASVADLQATFQDLLHNLIGKPLTDRLLSA